MNRAARPQGIYGTRTLRHILAKGQIPACEDAIRLCDEKQTLQIAISQLQRELASLAGNLDEDLKQSRLELQRKFDEATLATEQAEFDEREFKAELVRRETRIASLQRGDLAPPDTKHVEKEQRNARKEYDSRILALKSTETAQGAKLHQLQTAAVALCADLELVQTALDHFEKGQLAPHILPLIEKASSKASKDFETRSRELKVIAESIDDALQRERKELEREDDNLREAKDNLAHLKKLKSKGLAARVLSATWWGSSFTDYERKKTEAASRKQKISATCTKLTDTLIAAEADFTNFTGSRSSCISEAIQNEVDIQRRRCHERAADLTSQITQLHEDTDTQQALLQSTGAELFELLRLREEAADRAKEESLRVLSGMAAASLEEAQSELAAVQARRAQGEHEIRSCTILVEEFERDRLSEIERRAAPIAAQLTDIKGAIARIEQSVSQTLAQAGLQRSGAAERPELEALKEELIRNSSQDRLIEVHQRNSKTSPGRSTRRHNPRQANPRDGEARNLYIDLQSQSDDNTDKNGRTWPGLRTQLTELKRRHPDLLFGESEPGTDLLDQLRRLLFPEGIPQNLLISNLSLQRDKPIIAVRPGVIGPRLEKALPQGVTISLKGRLWNNRQDSDDPVLRVHRIVDLSHSEARDFEREVVALAHTVELRQRRSNLLTTEFVSELPEISVRTAQNLRDWKSYLDWKERLITSNAVGLRYVSAKAQANDRIQLLVVADSKENFNRVARLFMRSDGFHAFPLGYSGSAWNFEYNREFKSRSYELGDFDKIEEASESLTEELRARIPWATAYAANVYFWITDSARAASSDSPEDDTAGTARLPRNLNPEGFLSPSMIGDLALVGRQRRELNLLQEQSGYAPFLSSYLFDIGNAHIPGELIEICEEDWTRNDLNQEQKVAIRKMVSTPDLGMVQGPPGTGKTTMIAEATSQFVLQRQKVLLVSQANLAVENALERLSASSAIRAIRLGGRAEADKAFSTQRALGTYYGNIASDCRRNSLALWERSDQDRTLIRRSLSECDLLDADLSSLQTAIDDARRTARAASDELRSYGDRETRQRTLLATRAALGKFIGLLDGDSCDSIHALPEALLDVFYKLVVLPIDDLAEVGIQGNRIWHASRYGTVSDRCLYATEIIAEFNILFGSITQLKADLKRLRATDGEFVMAPEQALELERLQRRLGELQEAMVDDASRLDEWRDTQRMIRAIKRQGSGLDQAIYKRVFSRTDMDPPPYLIYTQGSALRADVIAALDRAVQAIDQASAAVSAGLSEVRESAIRCVAELDSDSETDPKPFRQAEAKLQEATVQAEEMSSELKTKQVQLLVGMGMLGSAIGRAEIVAVGEYQGLRQAAMDHLAALPDQGNDLQAFRQDWEPLIRNWIEDLERPATVAHDESSLLPTYIRACNVVGVTCTENRKTLEGAGHTRFDVVIVDEVSKTTPTEILMPLMMARTAILVGDHRQLPPLFKEQAGSWEEAIADKEESSDKTEGESDSELTAENFERFRKMVTSSLFKQHFEEAPESLKSSLFTQYRMHPQIMRVINQFYENRLVCGLADPDGTVPGSDPRGHRVHDMTLTGPTGLSYLEPEQHVLWIDSHTDPEQTVHHEQTAGVGGKLNQLEAVLIAKLLVDIEFACRLQGYGKDGRAPKEVGVVSFYGKQIKAIRETVEKYRRAQGIQFTAIRHDVNTVDRYQGQERPIVIVSMVRNPKGRLSPRANTAQFERINVAFSRAQELLVVVGSSDVFCSYPVSLPFLDHPTKRPVDVYKHIIEDIRRRGGFWQSANILGPTEYAKLCPKTDRSGRR